MFVNQVQRAALSYVWFPSLDDIRSGAYLQFVPFRRSMLLRQVLWLPRKNDATCVNPDREFAPLQPNRAHEPRRIWPADWPTVVIEIKDVDVCLDPPPPTAPSSAILDLFI
jgi:hypothetical protein